MYEQQRQQHIPRQKFELQPSIHTLKFVPVKLVFILLTIPSILSLGTDNLSAISTHVPLYLYEYFPINKAATFPLVKQEKSSDVFM